jgi:hypothetical protein
MKLMTVALIFAVAALPTSALAGTSTKSKGATKYAPGQQMNTSLKRKSGAPGASEYAPGQMKKAQAKKGTTSQSASDFAPGQRMKEPTTTGTRSQSSTR